MTKIRVKFSSITNTDLKNGYLIIEGEEIKEPEKTLEDKFAYYVPSYSKDGKDFKQIIGWTAAKEMAQIAKEHVLKIFDEASKECNPFLYKGKDVEFIRERLEKM